MPERAVRGAEARVPRSAVATAPRCEREFYATDPVTLARRLLGQRLVRSFRGRRLSGTIVEVEAYLGIPDAAAHTYRGRRTPRNEAMYADPGTAYVYFTYGMHFCLNIVAGERDDPVAVLLRALEPTEGVTTMRRLRSVHRPAGARPLLDSELCSGPARLCEALEIDTGLNGIDLTADSRLWIERTRARPLPDSALVNTPRIGVDYAGPWAKEPLRWFIRGNPHASPARISAAPPPRPES
jgi:DNA-3-methyladenine glycosylase